MNPVQRSKRLQAHNLRCQGLTYRQIGERMGCAHSTAGHYVREFELQRAEIIESLTADLLVHSVAGLQAPEPELHARHITSARELRLLLNSLDQVEDRRQKRERRVAQEEEADALKNIEVLQELFTIMLENDIDDLTPIIEDPAAFFADPAEQPSTSPPAMPLGSALPPRERGEMPQPAPGSDPGAEGGSPVAPDPPTPAQSPTSSDQEPSKSAQIRTKTSKTEQDPTQSPAKQVKSRPTTRKSRPASRTQQPSRNIVPYPASAVPVEELPEPPFNPANLRPIGPNHPLVRKLFDGWGQR